MADPIDVTSPPPTAGSSDVAAGDPEPAPAGFGWRLASVRFHAETRAVELRPVWQHAARSLDEPWLRAECERTIERLGAIAEDARETARTHQASDFYQRVYRRTYREDEHVSPDPRCACGWHIYLSLNDLVNGLGRALDEQIQTLLSRDDVVVARAAYAGTVLGPAPKPSLVELAQDLDPMAGLFLQAQALAGLLPGADTRQAAPGERDAIRAEWISHRGPLYVGDGLLTTYRRDLQQRFRIVNAHGPLIPSILSGKIVEDMAAAGWADASGWQAPR